jgi:hypothetical protein
MEANWYPSHAQLDTPQRLEVAFRKVLEKVYSGKQSLNTLHEKVNAMPAMAGTKASQVPNSAAITNILGLPIEPSDTTQLADGTKLTYVAAERRFRFL